jgi:type II secretory pathway component PulM
MRWQRLPRQRQLLLLALVTLLLIGIFWGYVFQPIQSSRNLNKARINVLQTQLATMQRDAEEVQKLKSLAPAATINTRTYAPNVKAFEDIFGAGSKVSVTNSGEWQIDSTRIGYADWLDKTDQLIARYRLSVTNLNIKRLDSNTVETSIRFGPSR